MKATLIILLIALAGCKEDKPCTGPIPTKYLAGQLVIHKPTGEQVRIVSVWDLWGGRKCARRNFGKYTVRFNDGAQIEAIWTELEAKQ